MKEYTEGERRVVDKTAGGLVFGGLFPYAVEVPAGMIARFTNESDALLDAASPALYEALKDAIERLEAYQGEWVIVNELYAPEWTHEPKRVIYHMAQALTKAKGK